MRSTGIANSSHLPPSGRRCQRTNNGFADGRAERAIHRAWKPLLVTAGITMTTVPFVWHSGADTTWADGSLTSTGMTVGLYEIVIRRRNAVRLLFGMKSGRPTVVQPRAVQAARVNVICVTPLGEETASTR